MRLPGLAAGFAPWALYLVMPHPLGGGALVYAGTIATGVALAVTLWAQARSGVNVLEAAAAATFAALTVAALVGGEPVRDWLRVYSPAAALWVLAAVMVLSMRTVPFTERYARQSLPESYWLSPYLRAINRRVSLVWSGCTLAAAVSVTAAPSIARSCAGQTAQYLTLSLTWAIPLVLVLVACRYTERATNTRAGRVSS